MFAVDMPKTNAKDMWTRHVLKSCNTNAPKVKKNALLSLQQKQSLENLFALLDSTLNQNQPQDALFHTSPHGNDEALFHTSPHGNDEDVDAKIAVPIPRRSAKRCSIGEKRSSLELSQNVKKARSLKRRKAMPKAPMSRKIAHGTKVEVVTGAKKKYLGQTGTVEKFLFNKNKWGIALDDGTKIALAPECLRVVSKVKKTVRFAKSATRNSRNSRHVSSNNTRPARIKVRASITESLTHTHPATEQEQKQFKASFPANCRPRNHTQTMLASCVVGRPDIIMALVVGNKVDVNTEDGSKMHESLIHLAVEHDNAACALLLIELGVSVDTKDAEGRTPLMLAAEHGLDKIVKALYMSGAHVNLQDNEEHTALMIAAGKGHVEIVNFLLANGADIELMDAMRRNALALAMTKSTKAHKACVESLIKHMYAKAQQGKGAKKVSV